jgi:hypothetical protein
MVLLPQSRLPEWEGAAGEGRDYALACSIQNYSGILTWRGVDVLVLNDEPLQTAVLHDDKGIVLVRWMYAPSHTAVDERLRMVRGTLTEPIEKCCFYVAEPAWAMIDAAARGRDKPEKLELNLSTGYQEVLTYIDNAVPELGLLLHVLHQPPVVR